MNGPTETRARSWESALDGLEAHLLEAEALLDTPYGTPTPWEAPATTGPLPAHLAARAASLLERQEATIARLGPALRRVGQQRAVTERIGQTTARPTRSIYIDASV